MPFSRNVRQAFDTWIESSTWHTKHRLDEKRFYRFVWSVVKYSRRRPTEAELREAITAAYADKLDPTYLAARAAEYSSLYEHLYEFAKCKSPWR